jgi:hypothetical protein
MERWCCVEAKTFVFTVVERASVVRLVERRKSFSGLVLLSAQSIGWLASTMEILQWFPGEKDFIRSLREGSKVVIVRRGGNAAGRFLEVAVYGAGGWRGIIFIPEGRDGRGWRSFVLELGKVNAFLKVSIRLGVDHSATVLEKTRRNGDDDVGGEVAIGAPSLAEVLRSGPWPLEVERSLSHPAISLVEEHGVRPEEHKPPVEISCVSDNVCYHCGSELARVVSASAARDKTDCVFGEFSAGNRLTGELNTYSSLLNWKSQLEKLKAEVDQTFNRICEGLLEFGLGFKPKVYG